MSREGIRQFLRREKGFTVVGEAADGEEAVRLASVLKPDVMLIDVDMPKLNGLEATKQIKLKEPQIAVLVLTASAKDEHIFSLLEAGAEGYLLKTVSKDDLVGGIRSVLTGNFVLERNMARRLLEHIASHLVKPIRLGSGEQLTPREIALLKLAARGMSNKDIALQLGMNTRTVKGYLTNIFSKMAVNSRSQAIAQALKNGWLSVLDLD
ncbi:MAG: response regulator transcription factor [Chloroflexi bacterium]|nr:response regulator transcription factor [Chloroflexota bacterium]